MTQTIDDNCDRYFCPWHVLIIAHLVGFTVLGLYCTITRRYLFADGSLFLINLLRTRSVAEWFPARHFAHILTQYPAVVLARDLGCRDAALIGSTYGATMFLLPVAGLAVTWWAASKAPAHYLMFPMLSQSILFMNTSFVIFCETHMAVCLFWCLLFLLTFSERLTLTRSASLIFFGVLATRTYESYLFLSLPLLFVAARRCRSAWSAHRNWEVVVCTICGLLFLVSMAIAIHSTVFPFDAMNRSNFANSMVEHFAYTPVKFSIIVVVSLFWCVLLTHHVLGWRILFCAAIASASVVLFMLARGSYESWHMQYISRVQTLYIPLIFGSLVAANIPTVRRMHLDHTDSMRRLWRLTALTWIVATVFQLNATLRWNEYREAMVQELSKARGVISFDQFVPGTWDFSWGWAMPSLSVALGALDLGSISTIICAPDGTGWQPFDPLNRDAIPELAEYGIRSDFTGGKRE